jgi:hypothetical protein
MERIGNTEMPSSITEAVDECIKILDLNGFKIGNYSSERQFLGWAHHGLGTWMRNNWYLWWTEDLAKRYEMWPQMEPQLIAEFNKLGIVHGDDRSGIILTTAYRRMTKADENIPAQVEHYKKYWDDSANDLE